MKKVLVSYSVNPYMVRQAIVDVKNNYSSLADSESEFEYLRGVIYTKVKPRVVRIHSEPDSCGGNLDYTEYDRAPAKIIVIHAITELH